MTQKTITPGPRRTDHSKVFQERVHDPYKSSEKLPTPTVCPECGAVFADGRWRWTDADPAAHRERCPACQRIRDHFPAGYVKLEGEFFAAHRAELVELARNVEKKARAEHPLERIMDVADESGGVLITTTDIHLAHGIGEALHHAYKGTLDSHYNPAEKLIRVRWAR